jgi:hypothetical protein
MCVCELVEPSEDNFKGAGLVTAWWLTASDNGGPTLTRRNRSVTIGERSDRVATGCSIGRRQLSWRLVTGQGPHGPRLDCHALVCCRFGALWHSDGRGARPFSLLLYRLAVTV